MIYSMNNGARLAYKIANPHALYYIFVHFMVLNIFLLSNYSEIPRVYAHFQKIKGHLIFISLINDWIYFGINMVFLAKCDWKLQYISHDISWIHSCTTYDITQSIDMITAQLRFYVHGDSGKRHFYIFHMWDYVYSLSEITKGPVTYIWLQ